MNPVTAFLLFCIFAALVFSGARLYDIAKELKRMNDRAEREQP